MHRAAEEVPAEQQPEPGSEERGGGDDAGGRTHPGRIARARALRLALRYPRAMRFWSRLGSDVLFRHRLFELRRETLGADGGARREAVVLDAPSWVNVIARDGDDRVLLVRQWRFGIAATTLEIPGGMIDPGETARVAAERELLEETGYRAARWNELGAVDPNPAFLTNRCTTFLAEGLERMGEPGGDGEEELEVELVPLGGIAGRIVAGEIRHALVIAAFYFYEHHRGDVP